MVTLIQAKHSGRRILWYILFESAICGGTCSGRAVIVCWLAGFLYAVRENRWNGNEPQIPWTPSPDKESNREAAKSPSRQASLLVSQPQPPQISSVLKSRKWKKMPNYWKAIISSLCIPSQKERGWRSWMAVSPFSCCFCPFLPIIQNIISNSSTKLCYFGCVEMIGVYNNLLSW